MSIKLICALIAAFFQSLSVTIVIFKLLPKSCKQEKIKFFMLFFIYCIFVSLFMSNAYRFIMFLIIVLLLLYFILKVKNKKIVLYSDYISRIF